MGFEEFQDEDKHDELYDQPMDADCTALATAADPVAPAKEQLTGLAAFEAEYPKRAGGRTASVFVVRPAAGAMLLQQGAGAEPLAGAPLSPQLSGVAKVTAALVLSAVAAAVIASKRQR